MRKSYNLACRLFSMTAIVGAALLSPIPQSASADPQAPSNAAPGCKSFKFDNTALQNNQTIKIIGGSCGGTATINVTFSGKAQFINAGSDPEKKSSAGLIVSNDTGATPCTKSDTQFNTFNLSCPLNVGVAPYVEYVYTVRYTTNNVSDKPLPSLTVSVDYKAN